MSFLIEELLKNSSWPAKLFCALYLAIIVAILLLGSLAIVGT
jgi:hypothetical protein